MAPLLAIDWHISEKYFSIITKEIGFEFSVSCRNPVRGVLQILELEARDDRGGPLDPGAFANEKISFT